MEKVFLLILDIVVIQLKLGYFLNSHITRKFHI
jgi:hypothetical protein